MQHCVQNYMRKLEVISVPRLFSFIENTFSSNKTQSFSLLKFMYRKEKFITNFSEIEFRT